MSDIVSAIHYCLLEGVDGPNSINFLNSVSNSFPINDIKLLPEEDQVKWATGYWDKQFNYIGIQPMPGFFELGRCKTIVEFMHIFKDKLLPVCADFNLPNMLVCYYSEGNG